MRTLIIAAALVASGTAFAADSSTFQLRDANDLVRACSVPENDALYANATGFCHGVLTGAYRVYESMVKPESRFVCSPNPTPTRADVMGGFVTWANAHPQFMKEGAVDTLFRYLAEAYPCKK